MKNIIGGSARSFVAGTLSVLLSAGLAALGDRADEVRPVLEEKLRNAGYVAEEILPPSSSNIKVELGAGDYAKMVADSIVFSEKSGKLHFAYSQPDIPEHFHLSVSLSIYNSQGAEIDRYVSDAGWISDASKYSPNKRDYDIAMSTKSLKGNDAAVAIYIFGEPEDKLLCIYYVQYPEAGAKITTVRYPQSESGL